MQTIHDRYGTGITVSTVTIQNAQPPEQVQAAFDDAVKANQDRERQKNEGQAYANDVIPRARGAAARLGEEAQGYRQRVIANAEGDASRFKQVLAEYAKAPAVTRERIYIETMQAVLTSTSKIMMDYRGSGTCSTCRSKSHAARRRGGRRGPSAAPAAPPAEPGRARARPQESRKGRSVMSAGARCRDRRGARAHRLERDVHRRSAPERDRVPARRGEGSDQSLGLHFKWPLLQNVRHFDMRILTYDDADPLRFLTQGNRPVLVDSFVKWRIVDVRQYYVSVQGDEFRAATRIRQTVSGTLREEFGTAACTTWSRASAT